MRTILIACFLGLLASGRSSTQSVKLANDSVHIRYERSTAFQDEPNLADMRREAVKRCGTDAPSLIADTCSWSNGLFCFVWTYIYDCGSEAQADANTE